jgi:hypothetical protein
MPVLASAHVCAAVPRNSGSTKTATNGSAGRVCRPSCEDPFFGFAEILVNSNGLRGERACGCFSRRCAREHGSVENSRNPFAAASPRIPAGQCSSMAGCWRREAPIPGYLRECPDACTRQKYPLFCRRLPVGSREFPGFGSVQSHRFSAGDNLRFILRPEPHRSYVGRGACKGTWRKCSPTEDTQSPSFGVN